jgi:hypothetical protein
MKAIYSAGIATLLVAAPALAQEPTIYELKLQNHAFEPKSLKVPAGKPFKIKLSNLDDTPAEFESKELRVEKIVAGKSEITVSVKALKPGAYKFVDEYHEDVATGTVVAE